MASVYLRLKKEKNVRVKLCVTAQHRDLLDQVLRLNKIKPDYDFNLMRHNQDLTDITSSVLAQMRGVLADWRPQWVLVHGDTTTTLSACMAAFYEKIPVAHVEAGLRSGKIDSPWPEEMNRRTVSIMASLHFAPTRHARQNLVLEGYSPRSIIVTGNTVVDALYHAARQFGSAGRRKKNLDNEFCFLDPAKRLILVTAHRRENFGSKFVEICKALKEIALRKDVEIIFPVHPNPNVQKTVNQQLACIPNIYLTDSTDYERFVYLMCRAHLILTDSGGIQEEGPALGKPVLVLRDVTERPEAVKAGGCKLVGTKVGSVVKHTFSLLDDAKFYRRMTSRGSPYGDGHAAERIVDSLLGRRPSLFLSNRKKK